MNELTGRMAMAIGMMNGPGEATRFLDGQGHQELAASPGAEVRLPMPKHSWNDANSKPLPENDTRLALESFGIKFGDPESPDSLLVRATAPQGWSVKPTDHYMYSHLVDDKGRNRASIGYKYEDRWVDIHALRRLNASFLQDDWNDRNAPYIPIIEDSNKTVLWRGAPVSNTEEEDNLRQEARGQAVARIHQGETGETYADLEKNFPSPLDVARKIAEEKLIALYPDCNSLVAYWDVDAFEFPEWESQRPAGEECKFYLTIYRDEEGRDYVDGGLHDTIILDGMKAIEEKLARMASSPHLLSYARCDWRVERAGKTALKKTIVAPRSSVRMRRVLTNRGWVINHGPYGCYLDEDSFDKIG